MVLTAVLVGTTAWYALETFKMRREMTATREQAIAPHLVLDFKPLSTVYVVPRLKNIGSGAITDIELVLTFVGWSADTADVTRLWRHQLMTPGEAHSFLPPEVVPGQLLDTQGLAKAYSSITAVGTGRDVVGKEVAIDARIDEISKWQKLSAEALQHYVDEDPLSEIAKEVEKIRRALES